MKKILFLLLIISMIPFIVFALPEGDVDGNGKTEVADYVLVRKHLLKQITLTGAKKARADVDGKGGISAGDYITIRKIIMGIISTTNTPIPTASTPPATEAPTPPPATTTYTCSGTITREGTTITVSPTTNVTDYEWIIGSETIKGTSTYSKYKIINSAKVNLTLSGGTKQEINCTITDNLVYHFKFDENNTKPLMTCNTYTAADKAKYDAMLEKVVSEAGYGSRAGAVEAARFIVGALDYKVPYYGSSKYSQKGLNIGQTNAWGCSNRGLDCYYFVYWVRSQNGLTLDALYAGKKYKLADEVNNVKVGDYLLTPCGASTCKNQYKINHIAIVIGVDDENIYVAEAMTNRVNALVVTKINKKTRANRTSLSLIKHVDYPKEGNVTDMWLTE